MIDPIWMIPILSCYVFGFYVFFLTGNIWKGAISYGISTLLTGYAIYYYYGLL